MHCVDFVEGCERKIEIERAKYIIKRIYLPQRVFFIGLSMVSTKLCVSCNCHYSFNIRNQISELFVSLASSTIATIRRNFGYDRYKCVPLWNNESQIGNGYDVGNDSKSDLKPNPTTLLIYPFDQCRNLARHFLTCNLPVANKTI